MNTLKTTLLWDRFLAYWPPREEVTGDKAQDIDTALRTTYPLPNGKGGTFAQKGGLSGIVITERETTVASRIPPNGARPDWLTWIDARRGKDVTALLNEKVRALVAQPQPHVILKTGKKTFTLDEIVVGNGTVVVMNEPGKITCTDAVRIRRARRALEVFGSVTAARKAKGLLDDRAAAAGDTADIDDKLLTMIRKLQTTHETFFDAVALLDGVTRQELDLAGKPL